MRTFLRNAIWGTGECCLHSKQTKLTLLYSLCPLLCLYHTHTHTHSSGSDQSQREEDFYYTKISCETVDASSSPAPSQQALGQASSSRLSWTSCGSPPASGLQIPPAHRPRSNSSSGPSLSRPSPLSQSAPSSFWQIHSEHLYQVGAAVRFSLSDCEVLWQQERTEYQKKKTCYMQLNIITFV